MILLSIQDIKGIQPILALPFILQLLILMFVFGVGFLLCMYAAAEFTEFIVYGFHGLKSKMRQNYIDWKNRPKPLKKILGRPVKLKH